MPLSPGDSLLNGQYRILRLLGRGGFGFVYQAQDTLIHREVAIKVLPAELAGDTDRCVRFEQEARAAAAPRDGLGTAPRKAKLDGTLGGSPDPLGSWMPSVV